MSTEEHFDDVLFNIMWQIVHAMVMW